jgi:hypothetical protein
MHFHDADSNNEQEKWDIAIEVFRTDKTLLSRCSFRISLHARSRTFRAPSSRPKIRFASGIAARLGAVQGLFDFLLNHKKELGLVRHGVSSFILVTDF